MSDILNRIDEAARRIEELAGGRPALAIVLGSGLGDALDFMTIERRVPYADIPGFLIPTISGHAGELVIGRAGGKLIAAMRGRFHMYEGHSLEDIVLPVRALIRAGAQRLLLTCAAGGVNLNYRPGDFMLISDHLNLTGRNPLTGPNEPELGPRFPDMTYAYDRELRALAQECASRLGMSIRQGVYAWLPGPSYETPAEIRMLRTLGADAVGMSTVPEVIAARHMGARVLGISCITNMAAGVCDQTLSHEEVTEVSHRAANDFQRLMAAIVEAIV